MGQRIGVGELEFNGMVKFSVATGTPQEVVTKTYLPGGNVPKTAGVVILATNWGHSTGSVSLSRSKLYENVFPLRTNGPVLNTDSQSQPSSSQLYSAQVTLLLVIRLTLPCQVTCVSPT